MGHDGEPSAKRRGAWLPARKLRAAGARRGEVALPALIVVVSFLLLAAGLVLGGMSPVAFHRSPGASGTAATPSPRFTSLSWGSAGAARGAGPDTPALPSSWVRSAANSTNLSWCDPLPPFLNLPNLGVNFSVAITPANATGAGPVDLSWNISVGGGGLPPYQAQVWVWQPIWEYFSSNYSAFSFNSSGLQGNVTLTTPGSYWAYFEVGDSTCTQVSGDWVPVHVWNSLGANPLTVTASTVRGASPLAVTYSANNSTIPTNWSVLWITRALYSNNSTFVSHTYYLPGGYNASACLVEPNGQYYTCATSPTVTVTGPSPVTVAAVVSPGPMPENVTFWANATGAPALPNGTLMWLTASNGTNDSFNSSSNGSVSLTERVACGPPFTYVPPSGNCTWTSVLDLIGPGGSPNSGALGNLVIPARVHAKGMPANWYPTVSTSFGPTNGSAPLNLTLNVTATNGVAPYSVEWVALGRASITQNGSFYQPLNASQRGWNGSQLAFTIPINRTGVYFVVFWVNDSNGNTLPFALPLVTVGYVLGPAPLNVLAGEGGLTANATVGTSVSFELAVTGGSGPYSIEWAFGDGTFASSLPAARIVHTYPTTGMYHPTVSVTDGRGDRITSALPVIDVLFTVPPNETHTPGPNVAPRSSGPTSPGTVNWAEFAQTAALSAVLAAVGALLVRWESRREGEELVSDIDANPDPGTTLP